MCLYNQRDHASGLQQLTTQQHQRESWSYRVSSKHEEESSTKAFKVQIWHCQKLRRSRCAVPCIAVIYGDNAYTAHPLCAGAVAHERVEEVEHRLHGVLAEPGMPCVAQIKPRFAAVSCTQSMRTIQPCQ